MVRADPSPGQGRKVAGSIRLAGPQAAAGASIFRALRPGDGGGPPGWADPNSAESFEKQVPVRLQRHGTGAEDEIGRPSPAADSSHQSHGPGETPSGGPRELGCGDF